MRHIIIGAGAIGGVVAGRLHQSGHNVIAAARGRHLKAIQADGLRLLDADGDSVNGLDVVADLRDVAWTDEDVILLAVKSQHTQAALEQLARWAPAEIPLVCLQNGVQNERSALRYFDRVYGATVMCPTAYLEPGTVVAYSAPTTGIIDVGRWPTGFDDVAEQVCAALRTSRFESRPVPDIPRWKHSKLLQNLGNAVEAICGSSARRGRLATQVFDEGARVLSAAGIDVATEQEDAARRDNVLDLHDVAGPRPGSSSWQSLHRGTGSIETDYLNGEIALLARLQGIDATANVVVQRLANQLATEGRPPGSLSEDKVLREIEHLRQEQSRTSEPDRK